MNVVFLKFYYITIIYCLSIEKKELSCKVDLLRSRGEVMQTFIRTGQEIESPDGCSIQLHVLTQIKRGQGKLAKIPLIGQQLQNKIINY